MQRKLSRLYLLECCPGEQVEETISVYQFQVCSTIRQRMHYTKTYTHIG